MVDGFRPSCALGWTRVITFAWPETKRLVQDTASGLVLDAGVMIGRIRQGKRGQYGLETQLGILTVTVDDARQPLPNTLAWFYVDGC